MKLYNTYTSLLLINIAIILVLYCQTIQAQDQSSSDQALSKIRKEIFSLARENIKSTDPYKKARGFGVFSQTYSKSVRERALNSRRQMKTAWGFMMNPTEIYKVCINSPYEYNIHSYCMKVFPRSFRNLGKFAVIIFLFIFTLL